MEPLWNLLEPCGTLVEPLWNPRGTLWNPLKPYLAPDHPTPLTEPRPPRSPRRTWWNSGGTLVGTLPQTTPDHPAALAEPGGTLVEPSRNLTSNHPRPSRSPCRTWNCRGTLVSWNLTSNHPGPPRSPRRTWWNPGGTLVEPCLKPPAALVEPGGTLVEPSWNLTSDHPGPPRSPRRTWWNSGGTLVEPSWNLTSGTPRTTPDPIWAETPKLSAVGEKTKKGKAYFT